MIGRTVGRYRILAKLGQGGMGSVWKAEDTLLGRAIALKFLPQELAGSLEARRRFLREARTASILDHPGIATVHDAGEADGQVYIAMQFIDGETVSRRLSHGPLPVVEALRIAIEAGSALDHAHRHGILHRDMSSRNIMVDREGRAVVVDFGLALPEGESTITRTGSLQGTLAYIAPEILQGKSGDPRSDVYSLGVVLYEMLTGRLPFEAERHEAVLYAAVHEPPVPPSRYRPDLPPGLDPLLVKALAKLPEDRHQSATQLVNHLQESTLVGASHHRSGRRASADAVTALAPQWHARQRWLLAMGLILLVSVAALFLALGRRSTFPQPSTQASSRLAVLPFQNLSADRDSKSYIADGIASSLAASLSRILGSAVVPWVTSRRYTDTSRVEEIARELNAQTLVVGTIQMSGERVKVTVSLLDGGTATQRWAGEFEEDFEAIFDLEARIAMSTGEQLKGQLTGQERKELRQPVSRDAEAYRAYLQGQELLRGETSAAADSAYKFFTSAIDRDPEFAEAHVGLGSALTRRFYSGWGALSDLDEAEAHFRRAMAINPRLQAARGGLIRVFWERGKSEECLKLGEEARRLGGDDTETLFARAEAYVLGGLPDLGVPLFERVLELDPKSQGAQFFLVIGNLWAGRFQAATEAGNRYLQEYGPDPEVLTFVGASFKQLGDLEESRLYCRQAIRLFGDDILALTNVLRMGSDAEEPETRREHLLRAAGLMDSLVAEHPDNFRIRSMRACVWGMLGNRRRLEEDAEAFLRGEIEPGNCTSFLAELYESWGEFDRAMPIWRLLLRHGSLPDAIHQPPRHLRKPEFVQLLREYEEFEQRLRSRYGEPRP